MVLGIGMDLCEVDRIRRLLEKDRSRFVRRVFLARECAYCDGRRIPAMHYAARFAAKEAFLKAVGAGWRLGWRQLEVVRHGSGRPGLLASGRAAEILRSRRVARVHLTLTHTRDTAAAVVVLEGEGAPASGGEAA